MNLLQMSLSGAVMILVIVVIRALAINRLPKKTFLALWGVVVVRLLIPYSLRSACSVYTLLGRLAATGETVKDSPAIPFTHVPAAPHVVPMPGTATTYTAVAAANPWIVVWALGALLCAGFFAAAYLKCRREFKVSLPVDNAYVKLWLREHRLHRSIEIRQSGRISAPLTYGVFRPVILMPKTVDWGEQDTLQYVLAHEYVHICRFDAVTKLVLTVALCVHWFNPAVWILYVLANRDMELSCDEAVIRRFGEATKAAYAMALIRMEETRGSLTPLCNNFSKNAIEERIIAIMKIRKTSVFTLFITTVLIAGMVFAFATSAQSAEARGTDGHTAANIAQDAEESFMVGSYTDPWNGKTYYSWDGGETWVHMSDKELEAYYALSGIEWWTAEEYAAWLENEKKELQSAIGSRAWTSSDGWFTWNQEKVDEAIAMYENILENIKNGMLYSKGVDGEGDLFGMVIDSADMGQEIYEGDVIAEDFSPYEKYDLAWDNDEKALYFKGQRVRYFLDGVEVDGGMSVYLEYADAQLRGEIDVHTVRRSVQNMDGSINLMGPITGLEKYSQAEFDARSFLPATLEAETYARQEIVWQTKDTRELLEAYVPFGLEYQIHPITGELSMSRQGKPVHSIFDAEKAVWIANSMRGLYLGPDAVDLEAVYERGKLAGLQETQDCPIVQTAFSSDDDVAETAVIQIAFALDDGSTAEPGTGFASLFQKYASFGISYVEAEGASGAGNVYYKGQLVGQFADLTPDGGAFTFTSAKAGGITVKTVYDDNGSLTGVESVVR